MKRATAVALILYSLVALTAWADCDYAGKRYPTGTRIGDRTCQPDGTWK